MNWIDSSALGGSQVVGTEARGPSDRPAPQTWRAAAAIAALPGMTPRRLRDFLSGREPEDVWEELVSGRRTLDLEGRWQKAARSGLFEKVVALCEELGAAVLVRGHPGYPGPLVQDPGAPEVLFALGNVSLLAGAPRVAVVGTRSATRYGLGIATELGTELSLSQVLVVSGLAEGIDAAAHAGVFKAQDGAPPVGVIGAALGNAPPRATARLRDRVVAEGLLLSETPPGVGAERWRFAARNRIMAALSHVVVVVESRLKGGSLHTVRAAVQRGIPVGAVPGSVQSPASSGTNSLIADGAFVVRDVEDVLTAIELALAGDSAVRPPVWRSEHAGRRHGTESERSSVRLPGALEGATGPRHGGGRSSGAEPPTPGGAAIRVLEAVGYEPTSVEELIGSCSLSLGEIALALERLASAGHVEEEGGYWRRI